MADGDVLVDTEQTLGDGTPGSTFFAVEFELSWRVNYRFPVLRPRNWGRIPPVTTTHRCQPTRRPSPSSCLGRRRGIGDWDRLCRPRKPLSRFKTETDRS